MGLRAAQLAELEEQRAYLWSMGEQHDAEMQEDLCRFVCTQGEEGREMALWLAPELPRPLWQIAMLGVLANKGVIMLSAEPGCDGELIHLGVPVPPFGAAAGGRGAAAGREVCAQQERLEAESFFEQELAALSLTVCVETGRPTSDASLPAGDALGLGVGGAD